jgi:hypothetical protein
LCLLAAASALFAACRSSTTSVPLPAADSAAIMAKAHAAEASRTQVQKDAVYVGGSNVSPHPAATGETVVQFVVDSTGAIQPSTFKVVHVNDVRLVEDAKRVLGKWRYVPAEMNGRKVAQLVETAIVR